MRAFLDPFWEWRQAQYAVLQCSVPVVAAVERPAIGAGFGLVGSCDMVIAGESATFGLTEINVGVLGGASKALRMLGPSKARRMLFLGELFLAQQLYRLGGVEEVVPTGQAEDGRNGVGPSDGYEEPHRTEAGQRVDPAHRSRRDDAALPNRERLHHQTPFLCRFQRGPRCLRREAPTWTWS